MPDFINIQYPQPLQNNNPRPFDSYLNAYYAAKQDKRAQDRLDFAKQSEQDRLGAARNADIQKRLGSLQSLGKYNVGGIFNDEQLASIQGLQKQLQQKIMSGDPSYQMDAIKGATQLAANQKKAKAYMDYVDSMVSNLSKNKAINPEALKQLIIGQTAYNPDGSIKDLANLNMGEVSKFNPLLAQGSDSFINKDVLGDNLMKMFPANTKTTDRTSAAGGITNQTSRTLTSNALTRINPATGQLSLNTEAVQDDPELMNAYFDPYRHKNGQVYLVNDDLYGKMVKENPLAAAYVSNAIQKYNSGKNPGDADYIEPNSSDGDLVGRAAITQLLTGREHGNFKLSTKHRENEGAGSGDDNNKKEAFAEGIVKRLKSAAEQDPAFIQNSAFKNSTKTGNPFVHLGGTVDLTSRFKNLNIGQDAKGKGVPASKVFIKTDDPGAIYFGHGDGTSERVSWSEIPTWLNHKAKFNKNLDPVVLNKLYKSIMKIDPKQAISFPPTDIGEHKTPLQKVVKKAKDTAKNLFGIKTKNTETTETAKKPKKHLENPFG